MKKYIFLTLILIASSIIINNKYMNKELLNTIKQEQVKYNIKSKNAIIKNNFIIPGKIGKKVNIIKSYNSMKKNNIYNKNQLVIDNIIPTISIKNNKDKYIKLNNNSKKINIIIPITNTKDLKYINEIINKKNINITILINTSNINKIIKELKNINTEVILEDNIYNNQIFINNKKYVETIMNKKINYCYTENNNSKSLNLCSKNNMYTITPNIIVKDNLYKNIKQNNYKNIITIYLNNYTKKELLSTIDYLLSKGYITTNLNFLIKE